MSKVMKATNSGLGYALAQFNFASPASEVWLTFDIAVPASVLSAWIAGFNAEQIAALWDQTVDFNVEYALEVYFANWKEARTGATSAVSGSLTADTWTTCECHFQNGGLSEFYISGLSVLSTSPAPSFNVDQLIFGLEFTGLHQTLYFDNVKVGTTRGATDIFSDDFEDGTFDAWNGGTAGDVSVIDDPFVPPVPPPLVEVGAPVRILITGMNSQTIACLDRRATDRQFLFVLDGPAYHTGQVASDDPEINLPWPDPDSPANLTNNRRLLYALQRVKGSTPPYQALFGGIVTIPEDQGTDAPTTRYTAHDPWQYMMSRPIRDPDTGALPGPDGIKFATGARASDIALSFLAQTELFDGESHIDSSDLGLREATDPLPTSITFDEGLSVGEAWTQLCNTGTIDIHLLPMYEPITAPGKVVRFQTVRLAEGTAAGTVRANLVMGWDIAGRSLTGVNRLVDGTRLANTIAYFAGQGSAAAPVQTDAASVAANGVYFAQQFFPGSNDVTLIALLAVAELVIRRNGARSITLDPAPERGDMPLPADLLGDYLPVWASRNLREPLGVDFASFDADNPGASGYQRVYAVPLNVDNNGVSQITGLLTSKEN